MRTTSKFSPRTSDVDATALTLITEQEVALATAAAVGLPSPTTHWWTRAIRAVRTPSAGNRPARRDLPRRYVFLENALMAREMERL